MNNQKWWTTWEHLLRPPDKGNSWAESRDCSLTQGWEHFPYHWVIPYHQESRIHPWVTPAWEVAEGEHPLSWLIPEEHLALQSNTVGDTSLVLTWSIFPSPCHDSAVPGLPTATHHKDTSCTYILNIERWSTPPPPCSSVMLSQLDWSECPKWDIVSI